MDTNFIDDFFKLTGYEGKLYIDENEECYQALQLKRITPLNALPMVFSKSARNGIRQVKEQRVGGNLRGDGYQLGGVLIVRKGGDLVAFQRQESPAQLPMEPHEVLQIETEMPAWIDDLLTDFFGRRVEQPLTMDTTSPSIFILRLKISVGNFVIAEASRREIDPYVLDNF
ncbi:prostamide/prostaglandin F synthase-like isoform X1 [Artemia franciscana]|uniref:Uncharacterized protein n=1 Tax=Artemia franciscana TaxID=6661 RepID=A0AA88I1L6_ARTSF|nr:hypothetical protein QYM36_005432 [Artemia franciscana]